MAPMNTKDTLQAYSEWLDSEGVVVRDTKSMDDRSHDKLADDFLAHWLSDPNKGVLAGQPGDLPQHPCPDPEPHLQEHDYFWGPVQFKCLGKVD